MKQISLKKNFINVYGRRQGRTFGGSQDCFSDDRWGNLKRQGCGIIAAVDTLVYLTGRQEISVEDYDKEVARFRAERRLSGLFMREFFPSKSGRGSFAIGIVPYQMVGFLNNNRFCQANGISLKWNGICGHKGMYQKMKEMLEDDIPVIWSLYSWNKQIKLYTKVDDEFIDAGVSVNSHYVTATGIIEGLTASHQRMIEVSSWGKCYYIDYDEYLEYVGKSLISGYCSNIIYKKKGRIG